MSIIRKEQLSNPLSASYASTASYAENANVTINTGSLLTTASANINTVTFTKGNGSTFSITVDTGSAIATNTGSLLTTASVSLNTITFTKGNNSQFNITIDTGSSSTTNTGSLLTTASATLNNIQFTKGDGSTFNITVDTGSGGTANTSGLVTTSSFNAFTSSINAFTSSYNTGSFSGSFTGSLNGTAATSSYYQETDPVFVAKSASLATTGSNIFIGNQTITGSIYLGSGSIISESGSTLILTPPTALPGQSLVLRPTQTWSLTSDHPSGFAPGDSITITFTPNIGSGVIATAAYTFTGCTEVQLGRSLTGALVYSSEETKSLTWTIPSVSNITSFTFTIDNVAFPESPDPFITLTQNGSSNNEPSHLHLISDNPTTVDLYLGDDDQYVKIEKNAGNVVIGTNLDTNRWIFGTSSLLTAPGRINAPSFSGSFTGSLNGTAATASYYQEKDPVFTAVSSSFVTTSSFNAFTSSIYSFTSSINNFTSSYNTGSFTGSFTGSLNGTAATASYYRETDPIFTAKSASLATTGSNNFNGNQTITGSLTITGSQILTGSLLITEFFTTTISTGSQETFSSNSNYAGTVIKGTIDSGVVLYDLIYLSTDGTWYQNNQSNTASSLKLGIYLGDNLILIEGHIVIDDSGTLGPNVQTPRLGVPVFIRENTGRYMSTLSPTTGYIRILGHIYYQNQNTSADLYIMRFNPSNDFYLLG